MSTSTMRLCRYGLTAACLAAFASCSDAGLGPADQLHLQLDPGEVVLTMGEHRRISLIGDGGAIPSTAHQEWTSSNTAVATVEADGTVRAVGAGEAVITAKARHQLKTGSASAVVEVQQPSDDDISITPVTVTVQVGASATLRANNGRGSNSGSGIAGSAFVWSSDNEAVAEVDANGTVRAKAPGTAEITAQAKANPGKKKGQARVEVTDAGGAPARIELTSTSAALVVGDSVGLAATVFDANNVAVACAALTWTSSNTAVAQVTAAGIVRALIAGAASITVNCGAVSQSAAVTVSAQQTIQIVLSPTSVSLPVGGTQQITAVVRDAAGAIIAGAAPVWNVAPASVATISSTGLVTAIAGGSATVTASIFDVSTNLSVTVSAAAPPPPVGSNGDLVSYPNEDVAFILGPQVRAGSASNPWPWFDQNAETMGLRHGNNYPAKIVADDGQSTLVPGSEAYNRNYYDVGMALYGQYYRTGNVTHLHNARKLNDAFFDFLVYEKKKWGGTAPRNMSFGGVILRAMDGRPDMWPHILEETRRQYNTWLGLRLDYPGIYIGVREGSYALMYTTWLAKVHPDAAVRAEMRQKALDAVNRYYLRLQDPDGGFYWTDPIVKNGEERFAQPFMVGLLLESFTYVHQLTGEPALAIAIPRTVEWLHKFYRMNDAVPVPVPTQANHAGWDVRWRNHPYFAYPDGTWDSAKTLAGGWDTNTLREARQANSTVLHAYGYAFHLTKDERFRTWGDEVFAATYGKGVGPMADPYSSLADYQEKDYGQSYRSGGRYLAWRIH